MHSSWASAVSWSNFALLLCSTVSYYWSSYFWYLGKIQTEYGHLNAVLLYCTRKCSRQYPCLHAAAAYTDVQHTFNTDVQPLVDEPTWHWTLFATMRMTVPCNSCLTPSALCTADANYHKVPDLAWIAPPPPPLPLDGVSLWDDIQITRSFHVIIGVGFCHRGTASESMSACWCPARRSLC